MTVAILDMQYLQVIIGVLKMLNLLLKSPITKIENYMKKWRSTYIKSTVSRCVTLWMEKLYNHAGMNSYMISNAVLTKNSTEKLSFLFFIFNLYVHMHNNLIVISIFFVFFAFSKIIVLCSQVSSH